MLYNKSREVNTIHNRENQIYKELANVSIRTLALMNGTNSNKYRNGRMKIERELIDFMSPKMQFWRILKQKHKLLTNFMILKAEMQKMKEDFIKFNLGNSIIPAI